MPFNRRLTHCAPPSNINCPSLRAAVKLQLNNKRKGGPMTSFFTALSLGLIFLTACGVKPQPQTTNNMERSEKISKAFRQTELARDKARFAPRENRGFSVRLYELKGEFDWEAKQLLASVDISFRLECACQESIILDSEVSEINNIILKSTGQVLNYTHGTGRELTIDLSSVPEALRKKEMTISIRYVTDANVRKNGLPASIMAVNRASGDAVAARVVYSQSEPQSASQWLPCLNDPSQRSQISMEFKMPIDETLIANGDLVRNEVVGQDRWMKYQTRYTLPNYLMAFALGQLTVATTYHGQLPVSIVARRGLPVDYNGLLTETVRQITAYEKLLVPFPFEKYMVVLLPEFNPGGLEHAGITFNRETGSSDSRIYGDIGLMAHELGHQWFGDAVTIKTWDDLWVKEGMATLLAEEAMRVYQDQNGSHRLFAKEFEVKEGDAIRDTHLKPDDKYTTGPYGRSAWLLTQIRSYVGEETFWSTLRKVQVENKFGSIGTDGFLEYFKSSLGSAVVENCRKALAAKDLPNFELKEANGVFDLKMADPEGALIVPLEIRWYSDDGSFEGELFTNNTVKKHLVNDKRLLVIDFQDRNPLTSMEVARDDFQKYLFPLMVPKNTAQEKLLLQLGAGIQVDAMSVTKPWALKPATFLPQYHQVASEVGKFDFLQMGCAVAKKEKAAGGKTEAWQKALDGAIAHTPFLGIPVPVANIVFSECQGIVSEGLYSGLWSSIESDPQDESRPEYQINYASLFAPDVKDAFRIWSALATHGPSIRSRAKGLANLAKHIKGVGAFAKPKEADLESWKKFIREALKSSDAGEVIDAAIEGVKEANDMESLTLLAKVVRSTHWMSWKNAYCAGLHITKGDAAAKKLFEEAVGDLNQTLVVGLTCE